MVFVQDELEEKLIPVQINGTSSHIAPEHGDILRPAIGEVYLLIDILVKTDADVRA
jgi:hypothetical protein